MICLVSPGGYVGWWQPRWASRFRGWPSLDEASKASKNRLVYVLGYHLKEKGIPVIAVAAGWMRTEIMLTHHTMDELEGQTETPHYTARGIAALASDPGVMRFTGKLLDVSDLADLYGVTDLDGSQPRLNAQHLHPEG